MKRYSTDKETNHMIGLLLRAGCRLRRGKHLNLIAPGGDRVTLSFTASDHRASMNARKDIEKFCERNGLAI